MFFRLLFRHRRRGAPSIVWGSVSFRFCTYRNAIKRAGFDIEDIKTPEDLSKASVLIFPGVGCFGACINVLDTSKFREPLLQYIQSGKPYMGICLGMQTLFEDSEEDQGYKGLGIIPGSVTRFPVSDQYSVPHIGWNGITLHQKQSPAFTRFPTDYANQQGGGKVYFVHSYRAMVTPANASWVLTTTDYGNQRFISAIQKGNVFATQFHPEKSGTIGLNIFRSFLEYATGINSNGIPIVPLSGNNSNTNDNTSTSPIPSEGDNALYQQILSTTVNPSTKVCRRIVACLDVRTNDEGDLVVTKGDKYDVREKDNSNSSSQNGAVRNLGKPVELSARYYEEGADEVAFLNITAFREEPLDDIPMLAVLEGASEKVFVPLTIGGGIRSYTDSKGKAYTALDVASRYFRAGADKISIGSDAVLAAENYYQQGQKGDGSTAIEQIAQIYGRQAVVVSVDPRRVYVTSPNDPEVIAAGHVVIATRKPGPNGEGYIWYQCTIKGGREGRPICAVRLAKAVEALGAGELLVNCVDNDGQKAGFDDELLQAVCQATTIPVIASSGAGIPEHFSTIFQKTRVEAALAAGIFHRKEVAISDVKTHVKGSGIETRIV